MNRKKAQSRKRRTVYLPLVCLIVLALVPAAAVAATVNNPTVVPPNIQQISFTAANGEANNLTITTVGLYTVFTDTGAPVTAGANCEQLTAGSARCALRNADQIVVSTGDGADQVTDNTTRQMPSYYYPHIFLLGVGNDTLVASSGYDSITAGDGDDTITGAATYDVIRGDDGNDNLSGGDGQDTIEDSAGTNTINGNNDGDYLHGGDGIDTITGGLGADEIYSGPGADIVNAADSIVDVLWCITGDSVTKDANDTIRACGP